jgi:hypothetical protein
MAKLYKVEMYILDINESHKDICELCDNMSIDLDLVYLQPFDQQVRQLDWHDEIDLNKTGCTKATYEKYFKDNS